MIIGGTMKKIQKLKLNKHGWGMDSMIGFLIGFVVFLLIIFFLIYSVGAL
jgi:hypothetical protein